MSYRLSLADPLPKTLQVTASERLDHAVGLAREDLGSDPVDAVHGVRKDIKKLRSLLRLARAGLPAKTYRRENARLRDVARTISGARDADVLAETVDKLAERYAGRLPKRAFTTLRRRVAEEAGAAAPAPDGAALVGALERARARASAWPLDGCDEAAVRAGAVRAYARGRDALGVVERDRSVDRLHDWRKRVKDLWYHQRLLRDVWQAPMKALAAESHRLADLLGDDHDLAVLADRLAAMTGSVALDVETMLTLVAERRAELQAEALDVGRRVYAEKPKAYGRRIGHYLAAAGAERRGAAAGV
jgi:CHAD domain-containing protein